MSFFKNASYTFATKIALLVIGVVSSIITVRILGAEGKGLFSLSIISASVIFNFANLGIGTGAGYYLGKKKVDLEVLAGNWLSLSVIIGISVTIVSISAAPLIAGIVLPDVPVRFIIIGLLTIPFLVLIYNFQMLNKANSDFRSFNIIELLQRLFFLAAFPLLYIILTLDPIQLALAVYLVSFAVTASVLLARWSRTVKLRFRWDKRLAGSSTKFGIQGHMANFLGFLNLRLDMLLINYFIGPAAVGYYSISVMIAERLWYLPDALGIVLYPRIAHGGEKESNLVTAVICRQTVAILMGSITVVLLAAKYVISLLYTDLFLAALTPLFLLLPGVLSAGISRIVSNDLLARGHPAVNMTAGGVALVINIISNIILIPKMGISGAALSTSISYSIQLAVLLASFRRITGVGMKDLLIPRYEEMKGLALSAMRNIGTGKRRC
ncbi:MAG: polysaccharide biosynthesis C-terminal domain-containing protein [Candidatus Krumholzibacteriota bacterium]|nr:polysaccharide biosynthesis C-terminal domain-containing protein [Candidatus Krumholzibacteriota bacterium]